MRDATLRFLADLALRRPRTVILVAVVLALASTGYAALRLQVNANTDDLIDPERPYMIDYRRFLEEFGDLEALYAVVATGGDAARARAFVDALAGRLQEIQGLPEVHARIEPREQRHVATRAMPVEALQDLAGTAGAWPVLWSPGGTAALLADATEKLRQLVVRGVLLSPDEQRRLGAEAVFELEVLAAAGGAPGDLAALLDPAPEYLVSETGRLYFLEIMPRKDYGTLAVIEGPLAAIRDAIARVEEEYPGIDVGLTGKPVLQADEMHTTNRDMTRASVLAVLGVAGLFMLVLRGIRLPLLAVAALLLAIAWTFGAATLLVGQLNLLSVVFTLILVGIGIDFGVHVASRYREERLRQDAAGALRHAALVAGRGNVSGAVTSSLAFLMTLFTDFQGLRELGIIAGAGLLLCLLAMALVYPALLAATRRWERPPRAAAIPLGWQLPGARHPVPWLAGWALLTVVLVSFSELPRFDGNVLELQAQGLDSVQWEHRVLEDSISASWFGAAIAGTEEEALDLVERARQEPLIGAVHSVFDVIQPSSPERTAARALLRERAGSPVRPLPQANVWDAADLERAADSLATLARFAAATEPREAAHLEGLAEELRRIAEEIEEASGARAGELRSALDAGVQHAAAAFREVLEGDALSLRESLPQAVRHRFVAPSGRFLVALHPRENVWDLEAMERFVAALQRVDPGVTGVPLTHSRSIQDMRRGFTRAALLALAAVLVIVVVDFRRALDATLALLPLAVSAAWLLLAMGILDLDFNLANFFSVPILIGIGVDNGIHLVHRSREQGADPGRFGSTHRGVLLTSLTSVIGFGCLMLAAHRGLRSLGGVLALGLAAGLAASLAVLPPLLVLRARRGEAGRTRDS